MKYKTREKQVWRSPLRKSQGKTNRHFMPSGTNSRGNHYNSPAPSQPNTDSYHYSNRDGSYYYSNSNGSTYYNNGRGNSTYTAPSGYKVTKSEE